MINKVILLGRVGLDPKINSNNAEEVLSFSLATRDVWRDKQGQKQEKTTWHRVVIFGQIATSIKPYLKKGCLVYVEGKIVPGSYINKEGAEVRSIDIVINGKNGLIKILDYPPNSLDSTQENDDNYRKIFGENVEINHNLQDF